MLVEGSGADLLGRAFAEGGMEGLLRFLEQRSAVPWTPAEPVAADA
jgi:hypothetical protein